MYDLMLEFLATEYFGNSMRSYFIFLAVLTVGLIAVKIVGMMLTKRFRTLAQKKDTAIYDRLSDSVKKRLVPAAYFGVLYLASNTLTLPASVTKVISVIVIAFGMVMAALFISSIAVFVFEKYWENKEKEAENKLAANLIVGLIKTAVWVIALVMFLDNIGVQITSLIAGLGIGGIAIAFAAQAVIADIFCFFTIVFDHPFEIGDYIIVGEQNGIVEHVGIKTTRVRALSGEQLVFANSDLTNNRIRNYKTMQQRRVVFSLGVTYDTPADTLREIPNMIREIVEQAENADFVRAHFVAFAASSLSFEIVYYVLSGEYDVYMDVHQHINLCIKQLFDERGIAFAFPTQTLHVETFPVTAP